MEKTYHGHTRLLAFIFCVPLGWQSVRGAEIVRRAAYLEADLGNLVVLAGLWLAYGLAWWAMRSQVAAHRSKLSGLRGFAGNVGEPAGRANARRRPELRQRAGSAFGTAGSCRFPTSTGFARGASLEGAVPDS